MIAFLLLVFCRFWELSAFPVIFVWGVLVVVMI